MLWKAVIRLVRRTYPTRRQYPSIVLQCEQALQRLRLQIQTYAGFWDTAAFQQLVTEVLETLRDLIARVVALCAPDAGKSTGAGTGHGKGSRRRQSHEAMRRRIEEMLRHARAAVQRPLPHRGTLESAFEQALRRAFDKVSGEGEVRTSGARRRVSQRGTKSVIFPWSDPSGYAALVEEKPRFKKEVVGKLGTVIPVSGHAANCSCQTQYVCKGFRRDPRKCMMMGGKQEAFPIRLVKCADCGQMFSLLPSFLAREKHYALDLIGHIVRKLTLFGQSLAATLEDLTVMIPGGHSVQTLLDWLAWFGTRHPASVLTDAGIPGSGYFQEDEGFEKEAGLRTYTVVMVEPTSMLVWHLDYVDHVDEDTLCASFEQFMQHLDVKVLGVTKDKWAPSTAALRRVCHGLWIAFCHRHCLQKFRQALAEYQTDTGCTDAARQELYRQFKRVLETSESGTVLRLRLKGLTAPAFQHPVLQARLEEVKQNAERYSCHHKRRGLTPTTSIVDNLLKTVKRKLRQVESFRDLECTRLFFRALANVRNFVPFLSGAKNAHQSPFMLAHGQTYDLPWAQVMNMHNAFVFTA
jgi:hypothetical protein